MAQEIGNISNMTCTIEEQPLRACELVYNRTTNPQPVPKKETILASDQSICTDHMVVATWKHGVGWSNPELKPYGPLSLLPTASCLHYATECFEGLKAYRGHDGQLRVFRIDHNVARLGISAARISLPLFEPEEVKISFSLCCQWMRTAGLPETALVTSSTSAPPSSVLQANCVFKRPRRRCCSSCWPTCRHSIRDQGVCACIAPLRTQSEHGSVVLDTRKSGPIMAPR